MQDAQRGGRVASPIRQLEAEVNGPVVHLGGGHEIECALGSVQIAALQEAAEGDVSDRAHEGRAQLPGGFEGSFGVRIPPKVEQHSSKVVVGEGILRVQFERASLKGKSSFAVPIAKINDLGDVA